VFASLVLADLAAKAAHDTVAIRKLTIAPSHLSFDGIDTSIRDGAAKDEIELVVK